MKLSKILKVIGVLVAIAGLFAAAYFAVKKIMDRQEPEYFDDNDFFECDNDLEIIEVEKEETPAEEEAPVEEEKPAPKKKAPAKKEKAADAE